MLESDYSRTMIVPQDRYQRLQAARLKAVHDGEAIPELDRLVEDPCHLCGGRVEVEVGSRRQCRRCGSPR